MLTKEMLSQYLPDNWPWLLLAAVVAYSSFWILTFIQHRRFYHNLPTPPHGLLYGNIPQLLEARKKFPPDIHPLAYFTSIAQTYNMRGLFYLDTYPIAEPIVVIVDPDVAKQIQTSPKMFTRHPEALRYLKEVLGAKGIFFTHGETWSRTRGWFKPAFSMSHLLSLVPGGMVEETLVFKEILTELAASKQRFRMFDLLQRLTFDLIGRTVADVRTKSQTEYSAVQVSHSNATRAIPGKSDSIWKRLTKSITFYWSIRNLNKYLLKMIRDKYKNEREDDRDMSILDLALRGYSRDKGTLDGGNMARADLDHEFMEIALDNAKTFYAAGADSTPYVLGYIYYHLTKNPEILSRVRAEHNQIFGNHIETTLSNIKAKPHLLNDLPFTQAILKESLRLHHIGSIPRKAVPGSTVTFEGRTYPIDHHMLLILGGAIQRDPRYFSSPNTFDPDRFLRPDFHPDSKSAYMPFEKGPRDCIGQQLAILEMKLVLVLTLRYFDFETVYAKDAVKVEGWGDEAYAMRPLSGKPKDFLPMRVKLREA